MEETVNRASPVVRMHKCFFCGALAPQWECHRKRMSDGHNRTLCDVCFEGVRKPMGRPRRHKGARWVFCKGCGKDLPPGGYHTRTKAAAGKTSYWCDDCWPSVAERKSRRRTTDERE